MLSLLPSDGTGRFVRARSLGTLRSSPHRAHHPLVQTFPLWSVMHGRYEDITNVDFVLTEPSHMIGGKREGGERWLAPRNGFSPSLAFRSAKVRLSLSLPRPFANFNATQAG
jgi:hypothetical protein